MKVTVTIDFGKFFKVSGLILLIACIVSSQVYMFLTGIKILNAEPTCLGELCFSSPMNDPVMGWMFIIMPVFIFLFSCYRCLIYRG